MGPVSVGIIRARRIVYKIPSGHIIDKAILVIVNTVTAFISTFCLVSATRFPRASFSLINPKRFHHPRVAVINAPVDHDVRRFLPKTKYASTWKHQVKVIGARRLKLIQRNAATYMRIGIAVVFGLVIGSLFSSLDDNLVGSLSRTGYMFVNCFLTLMLAA